MLWLAKKNIDTALGLDPSSGEIQATLGYWYHQTFDWHAAEITYRRAIDLNANQSNVYLWLGILLEAKEEKEEALKIYSRGTELNPMWDYMVENKIRALVNNNQADEAITLQKGLVEKASADPSLKQVYYEDLSRLYWFLNDKKEAIAAAEKSKNKALLKFYTDGDYSLMEKEVDKYYGELRGKSEYVSQMWMGIDYARAGAREKALDCFNNAIALKETAITFLLLRHFDFLNIKYLSMALITRKIRQTINF
jgi:tetratricopeptide (TPR) repeat protein